MSSEWESVLAASRLADAGRFEEAMARSQNSEMLDIVRFRARQPFSSNLPVLLGWQLYYKAEYAKALDHFLAQTGEGWLRSWAQLGVAKVASDTGYWREALVWCASAWRTAAAGEHLDLLGHIAGARGEVLLRGGLPGAAAAAFSEDLALLSPGNRYAGRVRCYQAHAWSRMGSQGAKAARLAYRRAIHSPGEASTKAYAWAGLAILAEKVGDRELAREALENRGSGLTGFWIAVIETRFAGSQEQRMRGIEEARSMLPAEYYAERWWLDGWSRHVSGASLPLPFAALPVERLAEHPSGPWTGVEMPIDPAFLMECPWHTGKPPQNEAGWWAIRDSFMP